MFCLAIPSDLTYFRGLSPWVIGYGHFAVLSDLTYSVRILEIYRVISLNGDLQASACRQTALPREVRATAKRRLSHIESIVKYSPNGDLSVR